MVSAMMDPTLRICEWCRGEFIPTRAWQKYCTPSCKNGANARRQLNKAKGEDKPVTAMWTGGPGGASRRKYPPARHVDFADYLREVQP